MRQSVYDITVDCRPGVTAEITIKPCNVQSVYGTAMYTDTPLDASTAEKLKLDIDDAVKKARSHNSHVYNMANINNRRVP